MAWDPGLLCRARGIFCNRGGGWTQQTECQAGVSWGTKSQCGVMSRSQKGSAGQHMMEARLTSSAMVMDCARKRDRRLRREEERHGSDGLHRKTKMWSCWRWWRGEEKGSRWEEGDGGEEKVWPSRIFFRLCDWTLAHSCWGLLQWLRGGQPAGLPSGSATANSWPGPLVDGWMDGGREVFGGWCPTWQWLLRV